MYRVVGMLLVLVATTANALDFDSLDWKKDLEKDNLVVYLADVPNSDIKAFRGVSVYDASLDKLVSAVTDMDHLPDWAEGAIHAEVVKSEGNTQWCYYVNKFPWPYKNRDGVIAQKVVKYGDDKVSVLLSTNRDMEKPRENLVRVNELLGGWHFRKLDEDKVELTYEVHMEPTGTLPAWAVNMVLTATPKNTLTNLHEVDFSRYTSPPSLYVKK